MQFRVSYRFIILGVVGLFFPFSLQAADCSTLSDSAYSGQCTGTASSYQFTMKAFRLRSSSTGAFVNLATGDQVFDVASVGAGATVAGYGSGGTIPPGTYSAASPLVDATFSVKGSTNGGAAGNCRTASSGTVSDGGTAQLIDVDLTSLVGTDTTTSQYVSGGNLVIIDSSGGFPITIGAGNGFSFGLTFDVGAGVTYTYASGTCTNATIGQLGVTMTAGAS